MRVRSINKIIDRNETNLPNKYFEEAIRKTELALAYYYEEEIINIARCNDVLTVRFGEYDLHCLLRMNEELLGDELVEIENVFVEDVEVPTYDDNNFFIYDLERNMIISNKTTHKRLRKKGETQ